MGTGKLSVNLATPSVIAVAQCTWTCGYLQFAGTCKTALHSALGWPREGGVGVAGRGRSLAGWELPSPGQPAGRAPGRLGSGARSQRLRRGTCPSPSPL